MSGIKYAAAMLAAGAAGGAAASAQALTTVTLDLPADQSFEYITLSSTGATVSSTSNTSKNFVYGASDGQTELKANYFEGDNGIGETTTTPGLPGPGESFTKGGFYDATNSSGVGPGVTDYVHLDFDVGTVPYQGTATFDGAGDLETISYTSVPEPAAWALLLAGFGVAGGALRGARRRRQAMAA